jgi:hypothetical protein
MTLKKIYVYLLGACVLTLLAACQKEEDPFVDRVAAPVLVVIQNAKAGYLAGGGLYAEPVVAAKVNEPVVLSAKLFELDKSGLLNNAVGIDSIPLANLSVTLSIRSGNKVADIVSDSEGAITVTKTWEELGLAAPKKGNTISLDWSGEYKGIAFARRSQLQVVE